MPLEIRVRAVPDTADFEKQLRALAKNITVPINIGTSGSPTKEIESVFGDGLPNAQSNQAKAIENTNAQLRSQEQLWNSLITSVNRYNNALALQNKGFNYPELDRARQIIDSLGVRTKENKDLGIEEGWIDRSAIDDVRQYSSEVEELSRIMRDANVAASDFTRKNSVERSINSEATALKNLSRQMSDYINANKNLINNREGYRQLTSLFDNVNTGKINSSNARKEFSAIRAEMNALGLESETLGQRISKLFGDHFNTAVALAGINALQLGLRQLVTAVRDVDAAMTEMRKVSDLSGSELDAFLNDAAARAQSIGTSLSDTIYAISDAVKLGYDVPEAEQLAESSMVYLNVGDDVGTIQDASASLISTMKAFNVEAENSMGIIDEFNEVGNKFSIGSADIGEALQRSASALEFGNNSLEESIGLITAGLTTQPLLLATMECKPTKLLESPKALCTTTWQEIAGVKVAKAEKSIGIA